MNSGLTVATWYDGDDGEILLNMDATRRRLATLGVGARVSLTVLGANNWYRHLSLYGEIARVSDDPEFRDIDRLALRYMGSEYPDRTNPRVSAWMRCDRWHGWIEGRPWQRGG